MGTPTEPLVILDHRTPGQAMANLPVKVPATAVAQLQALAERLQTSRGALARTLLLQGRDLGQGEA